MASLDPWETLGIPAGASKAEVRRAYRRLAHECHPDHNPGDPGSEARFKEVQAAYEIITRGTGEQAPQSTPIPADDDPFLSILAAYLRKRQVGNQ